MHYRERGLNEAVGLNDFSWNDRIICIIIVIGLTLNVFPNVLPHA